MNSIFLYEDRLIITFNWKNGTKTVSLAELEVAVEQSDNSIYGANSSAKSASGACSFASENMPTASAQLTGLESKHSIKAREAPNINDFKSSHLDDNTPPSRLASEARNKCELSSVVFRRGDVRNNVPAQ